MVNSQTRSPYKMITYKVLTRMNFSFISFIFRLFRSGSLYALGIGVVVAYVAFALSVNLSVRAEVQEISEDQLTMNRELHEDVHQTLFFLQQAHYQPGVLDDTFSSNVLDTYLELLDPNKLYFSQADIDSFEPYRYKIDDFLKRRDAEVAFTIFKTFRKRLDERTAKITELIEQDIAFDKDESMVIDAEELDWTSTPTELDDRWRLRIKNDFIQQILGETELSEARKNLNRRYTRQRDVIFQLDADDVFEWFMNAYTKEIGPHTQYMSHATAENFRISMSLSLQGIGAELRSEDDYTVVNSTIKGGPAESSGKIDTDDKIVGVAQDQGEMIDVIGWRLRDVVKMIRGDKGTKVRLNIVDGDAPPGSPAQEVAIIRDVIKLEDRAAKLSYVEVPEPEIERRYAVISIPSFYSSAGSPGSNESYTATTYDVAKLIKEMAAENPDGLIIDLRGNGGGYLNEAISLTGLFIDKGPVVQVVQSNRKRHELRDDDQGVAYDGPLAVLIDRYSASASEIFAAAIQDYGRGIVIGERSFGKGTVQRLSALRFGDYVAHESQLKFTTAQFFRINGDSTQHKGVVPDIALNSGSEDEEFGERSLDNALPWTTTAPAQYTASEIPADQVADLQKHHFERSQKSPAFQFLRQNSERVIANKNRKTLSLHLEKRQQERDQLETVALAELNAYRASLGLEPVDKDSREDNPLPGEDEHWDNVFHAEAARILNDQDNWVRTLLTKADQE